jgi:glycosyltransferase involved in cell wall biosynthesis
MSRWRQGAAARGPVAIVVVLFHREEVAARMFEQLAKVTGSYSLVLVDNGFDDYDLMRALRPARYIRNETNSGAIRGINQGLEVAEGEYVAVLHSDVLIYDDGWLEEIVDFMESRRDAGLVGLQGAHTVKADGRFDLETNVVPHRGAVPGSMRPTWRFTQVAMIDGVGWVMRNVGLRLDERYGLMHCYDVDLALQYIDAGFSVYERATDFQHEIQEEGEEVVLARSSRGSADYLEVVGGDDDAYFEQATGTLRRKWKDKLPLTRGFRDEAYGRLRPGELRGAVEEAHRHLEELRLHMASIVEDSGRTRALTEEAHGYVRDLSAELALQEDNERLLSARVERLREDGIG